MPTAGKPYVRFAFFWVLLFVLGLGWVVGGHVNVPCTSYRIYCHVAKISGIAYYVTCCYPAEISSVVGVGVGLGWGVMLTFLVLRTGYIAMLLRSLGSLTTWHVATLLRSLGLAYYVTCCDAADISGIGLLRYRLLRGWYLRDGLLRYMLLRCWYLWDSFLPYMLLRWQWRYECHNGNLLSKTASTLMDRWADEECLKKSEHPRLMHMMFNLDLSKINRFCIHFF